MNFDHVVREQTCLIAQTGNAVCLVPGTHERRNGICTASDAIGQAPAWTSLNDVPWKPFPFKVTYHGVTSYGLIYVLIPYRMNSCLPRISHRRRGTRSGSATSVFCYQRPCLSVYARSKLEIGWGGDQGRHKMLSLSRPVHMSVITPLV